MANAPLELSDVVVLGVALSGDAPERSGVYRVRSEERLRPAYKVILGVRVPDSAVVPPLEP